MRRILAAAVIVATTATGCTGITSAPYQRPADADQVAKLLPQGAHSVKLSADSPGAAGKSDSLEGYVDTGTGQFGEGCEYDLRSTRNLQTASGPVEATFLLRRTADGTTWWKFEKASAPDSEAAAEYAAQLSAVSDWASTPVDPIAYGNWSQFLPFTVTFGLPATENGGSGICLLSVLDESLETAGTSGSLRLRGPELASLQDEALRVSGQDPQAVRQAQGLGAGELPSWMTGWEVSVEKDGEAIVLTQTPGADTPGSAVTATFTPVARKTVAAPAVTQRAAPSSSASPTAAK